MVVMIKMMELMTKMNDMMMVSDNNNGAFVFLCLPCGKCTGRRSIFCQNIVTMMVMMTTMMMIDDDDDDDDDGDDNDDDDKNNHNSIP